MSFKDLLDKVPNLVDHVTAGIFGSGSRTIALAVRVLVLTGQAYKEGKGHATAVYVDEHLTDAERELLQGTVLDDIVTQAAGLIGAVYKALHKD